MCAPIPCSATGIPEWERKQQMSCEPCVHFGAIPPVKSIQGGLKEQIKSSSCHLKTYRWLGFRLQLASRAGNIGVKEIPHWDYTLVEIWSKWEQHSCSDELVDGTPQAQLAHLM